MKTCQCCFNETDDITKRCPFCRGSFFSNMIWAVNETVPPTNPLYRREAQQQYEPLKEISYTNGQWIDENDCPVSTSYPSTTVQTQTTHQLHPIEPTTYPVSKKQRLESPQCDRCGTFNDTTSKRCAGCRLTFLIK